MFERIQIVKDDSILGLIEKFKNDANPEKVDLGVGVYKDSQGKTPIMRAVKIAEQALVDTQTTKTYTDSHGDRVFGDCILELALGRQSCAIAEGRVSATQTPGGSAALRVAADFIASEFPEKTVWVSAPTWPNHLEIFSSARLSTAAYPYINDEDAFDFPAMLAKLREIPRGDVVTLHACCHNPTGYDLSREQWHEVLEVVQERDLVPLADFAYQGFGEGLEADAYGVRLLADNVGEMLITYSCCKNFGIYQERTGCLLVVGRNNREIAAARARVATIARTIYSSPPAHGSAIIRTVFDSPELVAVWRDELDQMRVRIRSMREQFLDGMKPYGLEQTFAHVAAQNGLFSYTGLSAEQVEYLRTQHGIYLVSSGRANIAGLTDQNMAYVCHAVAQAEYNCVESVS